MSVRLSSSLPLARNFESGPQPALHWGTPEEEHRTVLAAGPG